MSNMVFGTKVIMFFHQMQKAQFSVDSISFLGILVPVRGFIEEGNTNFRL